VFLQLYSFAWKTLLLTLLFSVECIVLNAEESQGENPGDSSSSQAAQRDGGTGSGASSQQPAPQSAPGNNALQVSPPSVTLPTPNLQLPPPLQEATPTPAQVESQPTPPANSIPDFNPPTAERLNLPSALPAGNPQFAPASVGMPSRKLDDSNPGADGASHGPGLLGSMFDWAEKLRFNTAVRSGYDNNVNSAHNNAVGSWFGNLNSGVNYRFGAPRLNVNASLTGGLTWYPNRPQNQAIQGTIGFGALVEYRYSPRLVLTLNTSSSYQEQLNPSLVGSSQNQNGSFVYSANSFAGAYQWSDLFTTITRLSYTTSSYLNNGANNGANNGQGFNQPAFSQSFRWLVRPTTTAVVDYNADNYSYSQQGTSSFGQSLSAGFDHTFNPKWFWNFRIGAEFRTSQNSLSGSSTYIGPYIDNNLSWALGQTSSINWTAHVGTQPSGQQNVSYSVAARTGMNYAQGITAKLTANVGIFYLIQNYKNASLGPVQANGQPSLINYNQATVQGNVDLTYELNRILQIATGYQYMASTTSGGPTTSFQEYTRGITYLQLRGAF